MKTLLDENDISTLLDSLTYKKRAIDAVSDYPNYEFKLDKLKEVDDLMDKLRSIRAELQD